MPAEPPPSEIVPGESSSTGSLTTPLITAEGRGFLAGEIDADTYISRAYLLHSTAARREIDAASGHVAGGRPLFLIFGYAVVFVYVTAAVAFFLSGARQVGLITILTTTVLVMANIPATRNIVRDRLRR